MVNQSMRQSYKLFIISLITHWLSLFVFVFVCLLQEFDRVVAESVRKKFDRINSFLFEGKSTGTGRVDAECNEWSSTFPHLE